MSGVVIDGGHPSFQRAVRAAIGAYPEWFVRAARLSKVVVTNRPEIQAQIAQYEHGSRHLYIYPGVGDVLQKAVGHELFHAVDDNFGSGHFFTEMEAWKLIHRNQAHFDIDKYRNEPLEYFADQGTKMFLLGIDRMMTTAPMETQFMVNVVFPSLKAAFGGG